MRDLKEFLTLLIGCALMAASILLVFRAIGAYGETLVTHTMTNHYIVQEGDTLSQIASDHLGDWKKWEDLAEWNELDVEWKSGIAYVWIKPGQELLLYPKSKTINYTRVVKYYDNTVEAMNREIFRMVGIKHTPRLWEYQDVFRVDVHINSVENIRQSMSRLKTWQSLLEDQCRLRIVEEIDSYMGEVLSLYQPESITYMGIVKSEYEWEAHRKWCLLLLAILDVESNGYFVRGKHGEIGPWQIKPSTYVLVTGTKSLDLARMDLWGSNRKGMMCAFKILTEKSNIKDALMYYNRGSHKHIYASKVQAAYRMMLDRAQELDNDTFGGTVWDVK